MHGLGAQKFADRAAQHGTPIAHSGVGGEAGTFELQLKSLITPGLNFTQQNGATVAQLARPLPKLVATVHAGQWLGARHHHVAGESCQCILRLQHQLFQAQFGGKRAAGSYPIGLWQRGGLQPGEEGVAQACKTVAPLHAGGHSCIHGRIVPHLTVPLPCEGNHGCVAGPGCVILDFVTPSKP